MHTYLLIYVVKTQLNKLFKWQNKSSDLLAICRTHLYPFAKEHGTSLPKPKPEAQLSPLKHCQNNFTTLKYIKISKSTVF